MSDDFSALVKEVRRQLSFSQEDMAHKLGVSFATINRWENSKTSPSRLARTQFESFCREKQEEGYLNLSVSNND